MSWQRYFEKNVGRAPRDFFLKALSFFDYEASVAIDLGCGAGIETVALLERGWSVYAIDREPAAIEATSLLAKTLKIPHALHFIQKDFETIQSLPEAHFIYSYHSLPFCSHETILKSIKLIKTSLTHSGIFAGSFFGPDDDWVKTGQVTGLSIDSLEALFQEFKFLSKTETRNRGPAALQNEKHWHFIEVIVQKA